MLLTTATAWADGTATLEVDSEIDAGTAGHYYVNMPTSGTNTLTLTEQDITDGKGTFKVYDDGGKNGNYSRLQGNHVTLIINAPEGYVLRFSGSIVTIGGGNDYISVYAGSGTDGMILANKVYRPSTATSTSIPINEAICLKQSLTVYFQSGWGSSSEAGFDLTVECIDSRNKTYDAPEWLAVDPTKNAGTEGYYYVNMPTNGSAEYEIPEGFEESFQVKYSHGYGNETGTITLTAPSGRKMAYSGEWIGSSSSNDCSFSIKEGSTTKKSGYNNTTISETTTTNNSLTIECKHNGTLGSLALNVKMKADPIRISNLDEFYAYTGNTISVVPTVTDADNNNATLTSGTDYDITFSPAEVKDKGVYTATISGKGNYSFTKTFHFLVGKLDYVDADGMTQTKAQNELTLLTTRNDLPATLTGWYLVADNITFSSVVEVSGTAHLILVDGTTMNANRIRVNGGNALNIYGQTGGTGKLIVSPHGAVSNDAGIGASKGNNCGTIVINGGEVTATAGTLSGSAGIGASLGNSCGTITINGGKVTATGESKDIGGESGSVTINGGQVTANTNGIGGTTVSLGWRDAENDFIQAASYSGTVSFQEGKPFILDDGTNIDATADNIGGKKIIPKYGTITYDLQYATISGIEKCYAPNDAGISIQYSVSYTGNTMLQKGIDYTAAITDSNNQTVDAVKTPGIYTLTITGTGSYTGTKTATIIVYGFKETLGGYEFSTSGDADELYYIVDSENALRAIATYVNSGNNAYGKRFKQTADITMTGGNFTPIGQFQTGGARFDGTYDGGNFTINSLTVTKDYGYVGLFGSIGETGHSATVKNVVLVSPTVTATNTGNLSANVGTLVSTCNDNSTVDNCIVINPTVSISGTDKVAGAIVGKLNYSTNSMTNCYFYDSNANHNYSALGNNSGSTVTNVERVYAITADGYTFTASSTVTVGGTDYYTSGTAATVTATVPSTGMKKFTITGTTASLTETLGQYTLTMPTNDVALSFADFMPTITVAGGSTYNGNAHTPDITSVMDGETAMTEGTDYTNVAYSNNINAGDGIVTITGKGWYLGTASQTFTISPASVTLTANSRNTDTYDGTEKAVTGYTSSVDGLTFAETVTATGSGTNAGDYDVTFSGVTVNETKDDTGNYVVTGTTNGKLTISKATPTVTPPTANTLTYTGSAQALVTAGSTDFGTLLYSLEENGTYAADIPTATEIGTHTVYYKVEASDNWDAVDAASIEVTISTVTHTVSFDKNSDEATGTMADMSITYGEDARTLTPNAFERTGYSFSRWNTQADGNGTPYAADATVGNLLDDLTLYAQWTATSEVVTLQHPQQTFSCSQALDFTDVTGLKAYIASGYNEGKVILTNVLKVPANTGLLIVGTEGETYYVPYAEVKAVYSNLLKPVVEGGTVDATEGSYTNYLYGKQDEKEGFYKSAGSGTVAAGKAYLQLPTQSTNNNARQFVGIQFEDEVVTPLLSPEGDVEGASPRGGLEGGAWYTLDGRKVNGVPTRKGLYIVKGKKVYVNK